VQLRQFLISALVEGKWSPSRFVRFIPGESALSTHWTVFCMGPKVGLDAVQKRTKSLPAIEPLLPSQ